MIRHHSPDLRIHPPTPLWETKGTTMPNPTEHENEARDLGREAGRCAASWLIIHEKDAYILLNDIDPEVEYRYRSPCNLSGEWSGDPTPDSIYREVTGMSPWIVGDADDVNALADAWQEGADETFYALREAHALRLVGRVDEACRIEREHGA